MFPARLHQTGGLFFFRPTAVEFAPELPELLDRQLLGVIGSTALGQRLIHHVGNAMKARQHLRTTRKSLFQSAQTSL
jgi:hypothetical protein